MISAIKEKNSGRYDYWGSGSLGQNVVPEGQTFKLRTKGRKGSCV